MTETPGNVTPLRETHPPEQPAAHLVEGGEPSISRSRRQATRATRMGVVYGDHIYR